MCVCVCLSVNWLEVVLKHFWIFHDFDTRRSFFVFQLPPRTLELIRQHFFRFLSLSHVQKDDVKNVLENYQIDNTEEISIKIERSMEA